MLDCNGRFRYRWVTDFCPRETPTLEASFMTERRIPDPTLMARLQLSVKGIDWAASLVAPWEHEQLRGQWSPHQHLFHMAVVETEVFQARIRRMLSEDRPAFADWDENEHMRDHYTLGEDLQGLAARIMAERETTVELLRPLTPDQWLRTAHWPAGEVDVAWAAERALAHALEHFVALLNLHQQFDLLQARRGLA
jgi:hypothetical protein